MREDIEAKAAYFLMRRSEPDWSSEDESALKHWLDEAAAHAAAYWRIEYAWDEIDRLRAFSGSPELPPGPGSGPAAAAFAPRRSVPLLIAATFCVALVLATVWLGPLVPAHSTSFATATGQQRTVVLKDGTRLELNTRTSVRAAFEPGRRTIWLDRGEAFFDVAHDSARPLIVHAGSHYVTVLGTKFGVRRRADGVTVAVLGGAVQLDREGEQDSRAAVLRRGDIAISRGASTAISYGSYQAVENLLSWREGLIIFNRTRLADALAEFERYGGRRFEVADSRAAAMRIGGSFDVEDVDAFLELLQEVYGLRVQRGPDSTKISSL